MNWDPGYSVGISGRYQIASNALTSNYIWNGYGGNVLSRRLRETVSGKLSAMNRVGVDLDLGILARHMPDSARGIGWFVGVYDRTHVNARYPRDLFDLAMFGNAMFADRTADLGGMRLLYLGYKQFEAGLLKQVKAGNGAWNLGLGLSVLAGNRSLLIDIPAAELYTHPDGEYLDGKVHGSIRSSSFSGNRYFDGNGFGFSGSLHLAFEGKKFGVLLEVADLGFISWTRKLKHTELDSVFVFEGAEVNLFTADGDPFSTINLDTVVAGFATRKEGTRFSTVLPANFRLEGSYTLNDEKWRIYSGVMYRLSPAYIPYAYVGTSSPLPKGFFIDGRFAYGGFGSWHLGLELRKKFADVIEIRLGTDNLEGYVLPMVGTSQSAYVTISASF